MSRLHACSPSPLAQGVIGYVHYFTGLPELLVGILGSALTVVAVVYAMGSLYSREPAPLPSDTAATAA